MASLLNQAITVKFDEKCLKKFKRLVERLEMAVKELKKLKKSKG